MRPEAHIQAVIELVGLYQSSPHLPADGLLQSYFRQRRYMGAKDKKAIAEFFYDLLRQWGVLHWLLVSSGLEERHDGARRMVILYLLRGYEMGMADLEAMFSGERFAPDMLDRGEVAFARTCTRSLIHQDLPRAVALSLPEWVLPLMEARFGESLADTMATLDGQAPLDLRVNPLATSRSATLQVFEAAGIAGEATSYSPYGLRVQGRLGRDQLDLMGVGALEVQDEASQLCALLVDAKPGQRVLDMCAGAGGKTLLMAAMMGNKGQIVASDINAVRLEKAALRLRRAGVHNVTRRVLEGAKDRWLQRQTETFDRVLVDAPCSGSGTWRRNPDLKWKLTPQGLDDLCQVQKQLLETGAKAVKKGGRLIYSTCSLFAQENQEQVDAFLRTNPAFTLLPVAQVWQDVFQGDYPFENPMSFEVNPHDHGMDGFFTAVLLRRE